MAASTDRCIADLTKEVHCRKARRRTHYEPYFQFGPSGVPSFVSPEEKETKEKKTRKNLNKTRNTRMNGSQTDFIRLLESPFFLGGKIYLYLVGMRL